MVQLLVFVYISPILNKMENSRRGMQSKRLMPQGTERQDVEKVHHSSGLTGWGIRISYRKLPDRRDNFPSSLLRNGPEAVHVRAI